MFEARFSRQSERLTSGESGAWETHDRAVDMLNDGEDVILLCVGDPDFRTPEPIIDNAVSHMRVGRTHYSPALGELKLRRAVADQETRTSPHPCSPSEVAIFPGATNALYCVMNCLLDPGDEVVIPEPMYVGYPPIMAAIGANVVSVPLVQEKNFSLDIDLVKGAVTARTRVVFINTPGNPTGSIIGRGDLAELAAFCREHNLWLVCDEVYSMFTYSGRHRSLRACAEFVDNVVMVDGLSKSHAMSGWRIGSASPSAGRSPRKILSSAWGSSPARPCSAARSSYRMPALLPWRTIRSTWPACARNTPSERITWSTSSTNWPGYAAIDRKRACSSWWMWTAPA